jgi:Lrp/AsnC family transcriptional regulator
MTHNLDEADRRILRELQRDSSRPLTQVAEAVGLSHAPCWRRIQRLRSEGYIEREVARLDRDKLGWEVELFVFLKMSPYGRSTIREFREWIVTHEQVIGTYVLLGNFDIMLHVVARSIRDYNRFYLDNLSERQELSEINSMTVLSRLKDADLPI